jgi:hypothetical protein
MEVLDWQSPHYTCIIDYPELFLNAEVCLGVVKWMSNVMVADQHYLGHLIVRSRLEANLIDDFQGVSTHVTIVGCVRY